MYYLAPASSTNDQMLFKCVEVNGVNQWFTLGYGYYQPGTANWTFSIGPMAYWGWKESRIGSYHTALDELVADPALLEPLRQTVLRLEI